MAGCSIRAAQLVRDERAAHYRSSVSRSYYAAYCAVVDRLPARATFAHGRANPGHDECIKLVMNIGAVDPAIRREIYRRLRILYKARTDADYRPSRTVERSEAIDALRDARAIIDRLSN